MKMGLGILGILFSLTLIAAPTTDPELEKAISDAPAAAPVPPTPAPVIPPPAAAAPSLPLVDLFSVEQNPGRGTLEYVKAGENEKIVFGPESGHYLLGMVFSNDTLPETIQNDFKRNEVIQLAMGTINRFTSGRVGQFGAATLMVSRETQAKRVVPLRIPGSTEAPLPESGLFLFTSPEMQVQMSDEEKLKGTFFAKGGSVTLSASGSPRSIQVTADGKKIPFKMQSMRMEILANLVTPFNSAEHSLHGRVEFPMYWPDGPAGKKLAKQLAGNSFNAKNSIAVPDDMGTKRRNMTGAPNKAKPSKRKPASPSQP